MLFPFDFVLYVPLDLSCVHAGRPTSSPTSLPMCPLPGTHSEFLVSEKGFGGSQWRAKSIKSGASPNLMVSGVMKGLRAIETTFGANFLLRWDDVQPRVIDSDVHHFIDM